MLVCFPPGSFPLKCVPLGQTKPGSRFSSREVVMFRSPLRPRWGTNSSAVLVGLLLAIPACAGEKAGSVYDESWFSSLRYRQIGPFRGGRSAAVTGVPGKPLLFYFGSTGGGVWRTMDGGATWENISDGFFGGSIGAVAVSDADANVIYVGGGEKTVRGNVSHGSGMWKSTDAGKTWKSIGLGDTHHIPRIRVHPKNPDVLYVAALGHLTALMNSAASFAAAT